MKRNTSTIAALIVAFAIAGCGGSDNNGSSASATPNGSSGSSTGTGSTPTSGTGTISSSGVNYLNEAAQTAQSQQQQSQTVVQKTSNPQVKVLAQQVTNETTIINQQITQVSQNNQVTINNTLNNQQQTQINNLNTLSGAQLDQTYVKGVVDSWKSLLAATLMQARQGTDIQVRQTANANILAIEQRLGTAEELLIVLEPTEYLADAYQDGLLEIQLSQLALQKGTNAQVKQFAQKMIDDHTQINANITTLAKQKNFTLPNDLSAVQQEIVALISSFSGADFDKVYMDRNVLMHAEDVSKTTVESQQGSDADIKGLAAQTLPVLQAHLQLAQTIAPTLQGSALYQLGQGLGAEMQIAQFVQLRATDSQIKTLVQQVMAGGQTAYTQLVQLAQQRNATLPLILPPEQVQTILQLGRAAGSADTDRQLLTLLTQQMQSSLQRIQALQPGADTELNNLAQNLVQALQSQVAQLNAGGSSGGGTTGTGTTGTGTIGTGTIGTGMTGTGMTGTGTSSGGTTGTGTIGPGMSGTGTTGSGAATGSMTGTAGTITGTTAGGV